MPNFNEYDGSVRNVIDQAIRKGVDVANSMMEDMTHDELLKLNVVQFTHDQCCIALALILSADENGDPEYAPASMRLAMRDRLCDNIRVAC